MLEYSPNSKEAVLRRKILGVKIRHLRTRSGLSLQEVGEALGIEAQLVTDIEFGQRDVTLPQLEVMALFFNAPIVYLLSDIPLEEPNKEFPTQEAIALRQRIIGVLLRQARTEAGRSQEDLARILGVPVGRIAAYELGNAEIPLPELETLAKSINISLNHFMDQGLRPGEAGGEVATLEEIAQFSKLPKEVREFLSNPANLLYIKIAMSLSELSADTLRTLAEGLLEVTY
ncbi:MAG TPA: helix-turn-helix domain-containing protein [Anaerolineae bacterium]